MSNIKKVFAVLFVALMFAGCINTQAVRQEYIENNPELSQREQRAVLNGTVFVGMTADSVAYSWGNPYSVSRSLSAYGNTEIWSYKYFYRYWRTVAVVYLRQDSDGIYRVVNVTKYGR